MGVYRQLYTIQGSGLRAQGVFVAWRVVGEEWALASELLPGWWLARDSKLGGGEFDLVTGLSLGALEGSGGQLDDGMSSKAGGEPPGPDVSPDFSDPVFPVEVEEIKRKLHEKGVDSFTGDNP